MPFIPHTPQETAEMLSVLGLNNLDQLFDEIPEAIKLKSDIPIASGLNERDTDQLIRQYASHNKLLCNYMGAGSYEHYIPACVWEITSRGEWMTAYTPYQAEASQGSLQLIWEYQTMMASLMGLAVSNASLYDGATALAEAVLMALRSRKQSTHNIWVPVGLHPHYREVLHTLLKPQNIAIHEIPYGIGSGTLNINQLEKLYPQMGCDVFVIAQPNFFGLIESVDVLTNWAHGKDAMVIGVVNPMAMSLLKPPGEWGERGVDIACGEGQPLGVSVNYGGPYFGFLCCQQQWVRQMPGRLVGKTVDQAGRTGFTLTLQAREQHIRRGKATSNICTNQGLLVTAATIYMSVMGQTGLKNVAVESHQKATYLFHKLLMIPGVSPVFSGENFHEFAIRLPKPVKPFIHAMQKSGIQAGYDLSETYPELDNSLLICVTETKTQQQLDAYYQQAKNLLK